MKFVYNLFAIYIFFQIPVFGQFHFVGTYYENAINKDPECRDQLFEHQPINNMEEFNRVKTAFMHKYRNNSPSTTLLKMGQATFVYSYKNGIFDCKPLAVTWQEGKDSVEAQKWLDWQLTNSPGMFATEPEMLLIWKGEPGSKPTIPSKQTNKPIPQVKSSSPAKELTQPTNPIPPTGKGSIDCQELIAYRDQTLPKIWDNQIKSHQRNAALLADAIKIRKEFSDDKMLNYSASNWTVLPMTLKLAANAMEDILAVATPKGYIVSEIKTGGEKIKSKFELYETISKGRDLLEASTANDANEAAIAMVVPNLGRLGAAVSLFKNLHDNLKSFQEFKNARQDILAQFDLMENVLKKYNEQLSESYRSQKQFQAYLDGVNDYLIRECGESRN